MPTNATNPRPMKKIGVTIREMEIDDLAAVYHLGEKLFTARDVPNLYRTWDDHEIVQLFDSDGQFCLVAELQSRIIGFALGTTVEKPRTAWKYGLLVWLGVAPEFQKNGVGAMLFDEFLDLMIEDGVRMILVDTEADNLPALRFFQKIGFGRPEEHIYLSLNLSTIKRTTPSKKSGSPPLE